MLNRTCVNLLLHYYELPSINLGNKKPVDNFAQPG